MQKSILLLAARSGHNSGLFDQPADTTRVPAGPLQGKGKGCWDCSSNG